MFRVPDLPGMTMHNPTLPQTMLPGEDAIREAAGNGGLLAGGALDAWLDRWLRAPAPPLTLPRLVEQLRYYPQLIVDYGCVDGGWPGSPIQVMHLRSIRLTDAAMAEYRPRTGSGLLHPWLELAEAFARWHAWFKARNWHGLAWVAGRGCAFAADRLASAAKGWLLEHTRRRGQILEKDRPGTGRGTLTWTALANRFGDDLSMLVCASRANESPLSMCRFVRTFLVGRNPGQWRLAVRSDTILAPSVSEDPDWPSV